MDLEATTERIPNLNLHEIIQIGAVKVNGKGEILGTFSEYVKPLIKPKLSKYCKNLTGIKQEDINNAKIFKYVIEDLYKFIGDNVEYIISWGNDSKLFNDNCLLHRVKNRFKKRFIDYQGILKSKYGISQVVSMSKITSQLNLENNYTHDALDDSLVFLEWLNTRGFNKLTFDNMPMFKTTYVSIIYDDIKDKYIYLEKVVDEFGVCLGEYKRYVPNLENIDKIRAVFIRYKKYIKENSIIFTDVLSEEYVKDMIKYIENIDSFHLNNCNKKFNFHKSL